MKNRDFLRFLQKKKHISFDFVQKWLKIILENIFTFFLKKFVLVEGGKSQL